LAEEAYLQQSCRLASNEQARKWARTVSRFGAATAPIVFKPGVSSFFNIEQRNFCDIVTLNHSPRIGFKTCIGTSNIALSLHYTANYLSRHVSVIFNALFVAPRPVISF
jgi:hypothetical protein